jgi:ketosteroid isomerase-like protein
MTAALDRRQAVALLELLPCLLQVRYRDQYVVELQSGERSRRPRDTRPVMSQENVETVRRILARWAQGDFRGGADELDPEVLFVVRPPFPEPATVVGPAGISDYMRGFLEQWTGYSIEAMGVEAAGEVVLASVVQRATGSSSGVPVEIPHWMVFEFRGGMIVRIETILDEADALESAGMRE